MSGPPKIPHPATYQGMSFAKVVDDIPKDASVDSLKAFLPSILNALYFTPAGHKSQIDAGVEGLRRQPHVLTAIESVYAGVTRERTDFRLLLISLYGELRRKDGIDFLQEIAWQPLPPQETSDYLTPREKEESIQAKAVQSLAYLRSETADSLVLNVVSTHPSRLVRIAAIDAFVWNHPADPASLKRLLEKVKPGEEAYVGMQHFHRAINVDEFNQGLRQWRKNTEPK